MLTSSIKYHILLLGGTGVCGLVFCHAALEAGHSLTLYCRNPSKIPADLSSNPNLTIIQGELDDDKGLKKAAACGAQIFISFAGPTLMRREGTPITHALQKLYPLLLSNGTTKRIFALSTASYTSPEDSRSLKWFFAINFFIKIFGGDAYEEIVGISTETAKLNEKIDWTIFRVPTLHGETLDENPGAVNACYVGDHDGRDGFTLDRGRLARWLLGELEERKWVDASPHIANA